MMINSKLINECAVHAELCPCPCPSAKRQKGTAKVLEIKSRMKTDETFTHCEGGYFNRVGRASRLGRVSRVWHECMSA